MKFLIVDDDEDLRKLVCATLEPIAGEIHEVTNASDALKQALASPPDFVILDVLMPGVDGYEVCYLIKSAPELSHTKVIMLTVRDRKIDISIGRGAFADAYLLKPFQPSQLLAAIAKLQSTESGPFPSARQSESLPGRR